jgi:dTDP-glucose 4,6-dehydratase
MDMKRVLVTGSSGFVGHHLVEDLLSRGYQVIGIDSLTRKGDSQRLIFNDHPNYTNFRHDLRVPFSETLISKIGSIDTVFSIASDSSVATSVESPDDIINNNVQLILSVLDFVRKINPSKFIHLSTDEVYGEVFGDDLHREGWEYHPSNPYSASKAAQDNIIFSYWRTYKIPSIIVHCANMFGKRQNPEKMIPKVISFLHNGKTIPVYASSGKVGSRIYLDCRNLSDALIYIDQKIDPILYQKKDHLEVPLKFNVSGDESINNLDLIRKIADIMNVSVYPVDIIDDSKVRPGYDRKYGINDAILRSLGWIPPFSFEEGLKHLVDWTLKNKEWM